MVPENAVVTLRVSHPVTEGRVSRWNALAQAFRLRNPNGDPGILYQSDGQRPWPWRGGGRRHAAAALKAEAEGGPRPVSG